MQAYFHILPTLLPLYIILVFGFVMGRKDKIDLKDLANFLVMVINPVVAFGAMALTTLEAKYLLLPFIVFSVCCLIAVVSYHLAKHVLKLESPSLLGLCSGTASTGYFGLPIAMMILPKNWVTVYIILSLATLVFEATVGYYLGSLDKKKKKDIFKKALKETSKIPLVYAVALGLLINAVNLPLPMFLYDLYEMFKIVLIVLGMTVVGVAMSKIDFASFKAKSADKKKAKKSAAIDYKFLTSALLIKHLVWPLVIFGVILIDNKFFQFYPAEVYIMLVIISIVPLAANTVSYASRLDLQPQQAAVAVLASNIIAFFLIPLSLILMTS